MEVLRTPNERFDQLARYPFAPQYAIVDAVHQLRMHYFDIGPKNAPAILFLHGEPTWSYLYRHVARMVAAAGFRAIAPDLIGFGRSDKPMSQADYSYALHVSWVKEFIEVLGLDSMVLVCHDWGGLIGLRLLAAQPELFLRVVASNTFLPTGESPMPQAFYRWRELSQSTAELDVGLVVQSGTLARLPQTVLDAYRAPFPDESYKAGVRSFPMLVPDKPDVPGAAENRLAWESLRAFERPFLVAFSDSDPITKGAERALLEQIPGASSDDSVVIEGASHFVQEDRGSEFAQAILGFLSEHPLPKKKPAEGVAESAVAEIQSSGDGTVIESDRGSESSETLPIDLGIELAPKRPVSDPRGEGEGP